MESNWGWRVLPLRSRGGGEPLTRMCLTSRADTTGPTRSRVRPAVRAPSRPLPSSCGIAALEPSSKPWRQGRPAGADADAREAPSVSSLSPVRKPFLESPMKRDHVRDCKAASRGQSGSKWNSTRGIVANDAGKLDGTRVCRDRPRSRDPPGRTGDTASTGWRYGSIPRCSADRVGGCADSLIAPEELIPSSFSSDGGAVGHTEHSSGVLAIE